jgi:hypothetical protein
MIETQDRNTCNPIVLIFTPSMKIPDRVELVSTSTIRNKAYRIDDFPAPVLPTIPTRYPAGI